MHAKCTECSSLEMYAPTTEYTYNGNICMMSYFLAFINDQLLWKGFCRHHISGG